jgi:hypothetical protein
MLSRPGERGSTSSTRRAIRDGLSRSPRTTAGPVQCLSRATHRRRFGSSSVENRSRRRLKLWRDDHDANLALLRELVEAVVAGRYEQNIETFKNNRVRVTGRFQLQGREEKHKHSTTASAVVKPGESYALRFEPY